MRLPVHVYSVVLLVSASFVVSCAKKKQDTSDTVNVSMPKVTGAVGVGATSQSNRSTSATLLLGKPNACAGCSSTGAQQALAMGSNFIGVGQAADSFSCMTQKLVGAGYVPANGAEAFMAMPDGSFKMKMSATVSNSTITAFKIRGCAGAGSAHNSQYISGSVGADGTTTVTLKMDDSRDATPGPNKAVLSVTGSFLDGVWQSKKVTMDFASTGYAGKYEITQGPDTMILKGSSNSGADFQVYSKFKLLGNSSETYALDAGSAKISLNAGADSFESWDSNGNTGGSAYSADVASGAYFANPTFSGAFSADEDWDCSSGSASVVDMSTVSQDTMTSISSCFPSN